MPPKRLQDATEDQYEEFVVTHGDAVLRQYDAHGIGVGRLRRKGVETEEPAVCLYVQQLVPPGEPGAIPPFLTFTPRGAERPVRLHTEVVVGEMASFQ